MKKDEFISLMKGARNLLVSGDTVVSDIMRRISDEIIDPYNIETETATLGDELCNYLYEGEGDLQVMWETLTEDGTINDEVDWSSDINKIAHALMVIEGDFKRCTSIEDVRKLHLEYSKFIDRQLVNREYKLLNKEEM